jgi:hypothetical protein
MQGRGPAAARNGMAGADGGGEVVLIAFDKWSGCQKLAAQDGLNG